MVLFAHMLTNRVHHSLHTATTSNLVLYHAAVGCSDARLVKKVGVRVRYQGVAYVPGNSRGRECIARIRTGNVQSNLSRNR